MEEFPKLVHTSGERLQTVESFRMSQQIIPFKSFSRVQTHPGEGEEHYKCLLFTVESCAFQGWEEGRGKPSREAKLLGVEFAR